MPTPLPPSEHRVTLDEALTMARALRTARAAPRPAPTFALNRGAYDRILAQPGCVGIRHYPVVHADGTSSYVLVGVDEKGSDMMGELANDSIICPPTCDEASPLANAR